MKLFRPTYLYVKTHNKTGLKYFGKTVKNPFRYHGSGKRWMNHIKFHGYDINTEIIGYFENELLCKTAALNFSTENNIVESIEWANIIPENGLDGGDTGGKKVRIYLPMTLEHKEMLRTLNKGRSPWNKGTKGLTPGNKRPKNKEVRAKISKGLLGYVQTSEHKKSIGDANRGKKRSEEQRINISVSLIGKKKSEEQKAKMRGVRDLTPEQRQRIRDGRAKQIITEETCKKLRGWVICVDLNGHIARIKKDEYWSQTGPRETWQYIFHKTMIAKMRRN